MKTAEEILALDDLPTETIEMPEWGCSIVVQGLSKGVYDDILEKCGEDAAAIEVAMLVACIKAPAFTPEQAARLRFKSIAAYKRIHEAIARINRVGAKAVVATKSLASGEPGADAHNAASAGSGEDAGGTAEDAAG